MTIENNGGTYDLICDVCGDCADESFENFHDAVNGKKEHGWKSQKRNGDWEDVCEICQEA